MSKLIFNTNCLSFIYCRGQVGSLLPSMTLGPASNHRPTDLKLTSLIEYI